MPFNCKACNNADTEEMVQCDDCDQWFHFTCAGVNSDINHHDWSCNSCYTSKSIPQNELATVASIEPPPAQASPLITRNVQQITTSSANYTQHSAPILHTMVLPSQTDPNKNLVATSTSKEPPIPYISSLSIQPDPNRPSTTVSSFKEPHLFRTPIATHLQANKLTMCTSHQTPQHTYLQTSAAPLSTNTAISKSLQIDPLVSGTKIMSKKALLLLQRMEEEKRLAEQRDKEFLARTYAILQEIELEATDSEDDDTPQCSNSIFVPHSSKSNLNNISFCNLNSNPSIRVNSTFPNASTSAHNASQCDMHTANPFIPDVSSLSLHMPSKQQLAARQLMSKEQVTFSGRPEEWPLFISWFNSSTVSCGYTNTDNLRRLQSCLKGDAMEAVRCRLMIPEQVPGVITTLQMLYGRPETIINNLIEKIRREPPPRTEKLQSIINFSLSVQNMCAVMEATGLHSHLSNPCLLQELTEKLPASIRLNWGSYRKCVAAVNLSVFSAWLTDIACSAAEVTPVNILSSAQSNRERKISRASLNVHQTQNRQESNRRKCLLCPSDCQTIDHCQQFIRMNLNDKWETVKRHMLCRTCLRQHGRNRCYQVRECGVDGCRYKHHRLLHKTRQEPTVVPTSADSAVTPTPTDSEASTSAHAYVCHQSEYGNGILFRIVPVTLYNGTRQTNTYAFLDDGSSVSLMDEDLAKELNVGGEVQPLCLKWTSNTHRSENNSKIVSLQISSIGSNKKYNLSNIRTIRSLDLPKQTINAKELIKRYEYLNQIPFDSYTNARPRILLGLDQWKLSIPLKSREGNEHQPVAAKTRLGWTVFGPYTMQLRNRQKRFNFHICECQQGKDDELNTLFKEFVASESAVVKSSKLLRSHDDEKAIAIMQNNTTKEGNNYVVPLLWKCEPKHMPDSRSMAERRLMCLEKRATKDPQLIDMLNTQIEEYVQKQYARKLCENELQRDVSPIWYLPIFPVFNHNKPNKVRIVWDAAAALNGTSLNSLLLSGPDIVPSLLSVLFRFRERKIAICADIKEMFHQVKIKSADQHAQRFLWRNKASKKVEEYAMQVMTFGSTCSPFCAQFVKNTNAKAYEKMHPRATRAIIENHYVDDYLDSVDSEAEAIKLIREVIFIHKQGGFDIRNFMSNSPNVLSTLKEKAANCKKSISSWHILSSVEKVLGMWWLPSSDSFSFAIRAPTLKFDIVAEDVWPTKREMLKALMSVFDPLGLIANFLILLKMLLQEVWSTAIGWDEKIQPRQFEKWCIWKGLIPEIKNIVVERSYLEYLYFNQDSRVQLHIFVDASELAYSAVAYFRVSNGERIECVLVAAKTKVAPLKVMSIPRLELEAAVLGTRLAKIIIAGHSITVHEKYFWSDSRTYVSWLNSDHRKYKQFVAHRIGELGLGN